MIWTTKTINAALILEIDDGLKVYTDLRWFFVKFPDWQWSRVCKKEWVKDLYQWHGERFNVRKIRNETITYLCEGGHNILESLTIKDIVEYPQPPNVSKSVEIPDLKLPDLSHLRLPRIDVVSNKDDLEKAILGFCRDEMKYNNVTASSLAEWLIEVSQKISGM